MKPRNRWWEGKAPTYLASFLLPALLIAAVFAVIGIYPFGETSLLVIDMDSEYVDYLAQLNESVRAQGSFLRSWNMGMGLNMLGLIAFYTASPFNLLVLLFPVSVITEVLFAITVLKIGLCGLNFAVFTNGVMHRRGMFAVLFATCYALIGYNVVYTSNIMWLDGVAFLPLVLLGVEQLLRQRKSGLLLVSLIVVFFTSYYIGYMVGAFSFLYFTAVWLRDFEGKITGYLSALGRFVGTALLAAGCCAFLLLPAFLNLKNGQTSMWDLPVSFSLKHSLVDLSVKLLPGAYDSLTDAGLPNVYCTVFGVLLCVVYFTHKTITRREKFIFGGLLGFLLLSFSCNFLYLGWHAFEDPTWFPARYSFVFSFLLLYLAMRAFARVDTLEPAALAGGVTLVILLFLEIGIQRYAFTSWKHVAAGMVLALVYGCLCYLLRHIRHRALLAVLLLAVCGEAWANAYLLIDGVDEQFTYKPRESYTGYRETYEPVLEEMWRLDSGVYRTEILEKRNANGGMMLGYNGISHYSTTTDQALNVFLRELGYNKGTTNELRFAQNTPLTNGVLGIKYVLSPKDLGEGYEQVGGVGSMGIYHNRYAFPMAFTSTGEALGEIGGERDPFALQNRMVGQLYPDLSPPFLVADQVVEVLHNVERGDAGQYIQYNRRVGTEAAVVEFQIHNRAEREVYAYFPVWNGRNSRARVWLNGEETQWDLAYRNNTVLYLGDRRDITLELELEGDPARIQGAYFYTLDPMVAGEAALRANQNSAAFSAFLDTWVQMDAVAEEGEVLLTTFPYDEGWAIQVNEKRIQPASYMGVFLAIPLEPGENRISMRYWPPGFLPGYYISAATVVAVLLAGYLRRRKK